MSQPYAAWVCRSSVAGGAGLRVHLWLRYPARASNEAKKCFHPGVHDRTSSPPALRRTDALCSSMIIHMHGMAFTGAAAWDATIHSVSPALEQRVQSTLDACMHMITGDACMSANTVRAFIRRAVKRAQLTLWCYDKYLRDRYPATAKEAPVSCACRSRCTQAPSWSLRCSADEAVAAHAAGLAYLYKMRAARGNFTPA
eukprot:Opistho-2@63388